MAFKSLQTLFSQGIKPSPWLHIAKPDSLILEYNQTMNDPYILYIYWLYGMIGLSVIGIILGIIEYFKQD